MDKVDKKINDFINLLKERTINPIDNTDIKESCTATLLLIFAAADSLSKITCCDKDYNLLKNRSGNAERFKGFLENVMGNEYLKFKDAIYDLRNDIVHTGINTKVIFSKSQHDNKHLQKVNGHLWINTSQFLDDFKKAIEQINIDIKNKGRYFKNAMNRLKEFNIIELDEQQDVATPSPGPDDSPFQL